MPKIQIPEKIERLLTCKHRYVVLIGGRGSAKSESTGQILLQRCQTEAADVLCVREYQNSIDDSVHKLLKILIVRTGCAGFSVTDKKIDCSTGGGFRFQGLSRNPESVRSKQNYKYAWAEEAHRLSSDSIDDLINTIRATGSQIFFTANPGSSSDAFSRRFIIPFQKELLANGYYEDALHLVIIINWRDNPWHGELEAARQWDFDNLPRSRYDHIWEGQFNDSVDDPLIHPEWFDACIDAHVRLGFEPIGLKIGSHDPSDLGADEKGFVYRHGSVVLDIQGKRTGDINEGCDWACNLAIGHGVDVFTWDCDGMGVGLNRQVDQHFEGKRITATQFKGSEAVDFPGEIFDKAQNMPASQQKTNKQALKNKRAQYYYALRLRMHNTYQAINGKYKDPDELLSLSSDIKCLPQLRAELCRMPIKPNANGLFELYKKIELKTKYAFSSPNLADALMMSLRTPKIDKTTTQRLSAREFMRRFG